MSEINQIQVGGTVYTLPSGGSSTGTVIGSGNTVLSSPAYILGNNNYTSGTETIALGSGNTIYGSYSITLGKANHIDYKGSVALGYYNSPASYGTIATGNFNCCNKTGVLANENTFQYGVTSAADVYGTTSDSKLGAASHAGFIGLELSKVNYPFFELEVGDTFIGNIQVISLGTGVSTMATVRINACQIVSQDVPSGFPSITFSMNNGILYIDDFPDGDRFNTQIAMWYNLASNSSSSSGGGGSWSSNSSMYSSYSGS